MKYNLVYVKSKKDERVVMGKNHVTVYTSNSDVKKDFHIIRKFTGCQKSC